MTIEEFLIKIREKYPYTVNNIHKPLTEGYHIVDNMDAAAYDIACIAREVMLKRGNTINGYEDEYFEYSGWNFNPNYKNSILKLGKNAKAAPQPINKLNDKTFNYPIYLQIGFYPNSTTDACSSWRENNPSDEEGALNPFYNIGLSINAAHYNNAGVSTYEDDDKRNVRDIRDEKRFLTLISSISHELQHIFEMYILPDKNIIDSAKHLGMTITFDETPFKLGIKSSFIIKMILTACTKDEWRGRFAELRAFLKNMKNREFDSIRREVFNGTVNNRVRDKYAKKHLSDGMFQTRQGLIYSLANHPLIQAITEVKYYQKAFDELAQFEKDDKRKYYAYMLIIGYFLNKHGELDLKGVGADTRKAISKLTNPTTIARAVRIENGDIYFVAEIKQTLIEYVDIIKESMMRLFDEYCYEVNCQLYHDFDSLYTFEDCNRYFDTKGFQNGEVVLL